MPTVGSTSLRSSSTVVGSRTVSAKVASFESASDIAPHPSARTYDVMPSAAQRSIRVVSPSAMVGRSAHASEVAHAFVARSQPAGQGE
jgi:hypothetical protein